MSNLDLWRQAAENIHWYKPPSEVLDDSNPPFYRWYPDGETNACYNALDIHVEQGRGDQAALIYDSPVTDTKRQYNYAELLDTVSRFAGVLAWPQSHYDWIRPGWADRPTATGNGV